MKIAYFTEQFVTSMNHWLDPLVAELCRREGLAESMFTNASFQMDGNVQFTVIFGLGSS